MIKTSHTARRRLSYSVIAATTLLISAQVATAAKVDARIIAARAAMDAAAIEDIAGITKGVADQFGTGSIKMSGKNVKSLAQFAANAIVAKQPETGVNSALNKGDEIGETIALVLNGISANAKFLKLGKAKALTLTAMKGALNTAKKTATLTPTTVFRDVGGSVALTVTNKTTLDATFKTKLLAYLGKKAKTVAGKVNKPFIQAGLSAGAGADPDANLKYEDGAVTTLFVPGDPETDNRPA